MHKTIKFTYTSIIDYVYDTDGHRHVKVPIFFDKKSYSNYAVDFIFDTGAYLTVLTQKTAKYFGFEKIKPIAKNIPLNGFAGSRCEGDLVEIPKMMLGGKMLEDVKVAIPYIDTEDDILGLNVIEHFNYFIDSKNDKIHFSENLDYKPPAELKSGRVYSVSPKKLHP